MNRAKKEIEETFRILKEKLESLRNLINEPPVASPAAPKREGRRRSTFGEDWSSLRAVWKDNKEWLTIPALQEVAYKEMVNHPEIFKKPNPFSRGKIHVNGKTLISFVKSEEFKQQYPVLYFQYKKYLEGKLRGEAPSASFRFRHEGSQ